MELVKGKPYFCDIKNKIKQYPYLDKDIKCDVLIIGGGVIGSIANYFVSNEFDTVLVDKGRLGFLCSSCSTALLEYNLDDDAKTLKKNLKENEIANMYKMGQIGLKNIDNFIQKIGNHCDYEKKDVFIYSNFIKDNADILKEYEFLSKYGFNAELIDKENNSYNFKIESGIKLPQSGATLNTYKLTKQLIENSKNQNKIFENTKVISYKKYRNKFIAITNFGQKITCSNIIFATGFNFELLELGQLCRPFITYAIVTNPIKNFDWGNNSLIQDFADPYHYLKRLPDGRINLGGEDTPFNFGDTIKEDVAKKKELKLLDFLKEMFPSIKNELKIDYSFCGAFGSTRNNLGYIGKYKNNLYYFFSMGANGIVNAFYGIDIVLNELKNKENNNIAKLFSPNRLSKK